MQRATGIMLVATMVAATLAGCAFEDRRNDYLYSRADGLWDSTPQLIDWNFPTARNQGPIIKPERLRAERTAIGVPWATVNPWPWYDAVPPFDAPSGWTPHAHDNAAPQDTSSATSQPKSVRISAAGGTQRTD
jgi:hypothetical protein